MYSELKDLNIKLFGKTIQSPEMSDLTSASSSLLLPPHLQLPSHDDPTEASDDCITEDDDKSTDSDKAPLGNTLSDAKKEDRIGTDSNGNLIKDSNPKTLSAENETQEASKTEEEQSESSNSQDKTLKKPDKILPCPRCNSMETKFCYYNNYNVNQPRHFCKKCQRYWTAGGTMRNVPVGAGRRKNKNSVSQYRQICVSNPIPVNTNGRVLAFGSDSPHSPLCESMSSVFKVAEKTTDEQPKVEDHTNKSSSKDDVNLPNYPPPPPPQVQFLPPWPYPWNPNFCPPPGFVMPFFPPTPYWGCTVPVQWIAPPVENPGPTPATLGKHSRTEENENNNTENCLWIPKTLRIDDPGEAAKSSIWATLGIQNDKDESFSRGGSLFKAFGSKGDQKNRNADTCPALQANPAALSRSQNFHESS